MLINTPETWLYEFLKRTRTVNIGDHANPQSVAVYALAEVETGPVDENCMPKITLPSIIMTPTFDNKSETFEGASGPTNIICDVRATTYAQADDIRAQCIEALNDNELNENMVFSHARKSSAELLDLSQPGAAPIYGASFEVWIH